MFIINQLKIPIKNCKKNEFDNIADAKTNEKEILNKDLINVLAKTLKIDSASIKNIKILKKSIDARKKPELYYIYQVAFDLVDTKLQRKLLQHNKIEIYHSINYQFPLNDYQIKNVDEIDRPVIIGTGPAGLFCGYYLAKCGLRPILIERGLPVKQRKEEVNKYWETGNLNGNCNIQFGEGGAGTFSDGKLQTQVKDKTGRIKEILKTFVKHGAPEEIIYLNKPHIGTDILEKVIENMRESMLQMGAEFCFETTFQNLIYENKQITGISIIDKNGMTKKMLCRNVILCIGHSARDTFLNLHEDGLIMENKPFAVGFRVQHSQKMIDQSQYGAGYEEKGLPAADYKLTFQKESNNGIRNIYSFCMCPGGYVVNASSEKGKLAINGMSYHDRASDNANSAIVMSVTEDDYGHHLFDGMKFQREIEEKAYLCADGKVPIQSYGDFASKYKENNNLVNSQNTDFSNLAPVIKGLYSYAKVNTILSDVLNQDFIAGMSRFGEIIPGFDDDNVIVAGIESRTSSPVKILRDENFESNIKGVYPCGEGAGYAGGITSAALDGLKVAEIVALRYNL